jgi:hypothetical protein
LNGSVVIAHRPRLLGGWHTRVGPGQVAINVQSRLTGLSFAELEEFFRDVHRRIILDGPNTKPAAVARRVLKVWDERGRLRRA